MKRMNQILAGHKFVANFLEEPVTIARIFKMDDKQFIPALDFNDVFPGVNLGRFTSTASKGVMKFSQQKDVSIEFGGRATTTVGQSQVSLTFKRQRSVAGAIDDAFVESLRYVNLLEKLKQIWIDHDFVRFLKSYIFVFETVTAASGTIIYSVERNNRVVLEHSLDDKVTKIADLASGNFEYVSNTKQTLEIIRTVAHKPLFKAFRFRQNWQPEILG